MHTVSTLLQATPVIVMCKSNSLLNETGLYQASCGNKKHTEAKDTTSKTFVEAFICKYKYQNDIAYAQKYMIVNHHVDRSKL